MQSIRLAYAKCYQCIKEGVDAGAGAEKDVIQFGKYSICLCEKHLNQVIGKMFGQDRIENISHTETR